VSSSNSVICAMRADPVDARDVAESVAHVAGPTIDCSLPGCEDGVDRAQEACDVRDLVAVKPSWKAFEL